MTGLVSASIAWFSAAKTPGVRLSYSKDNGRTFSPAVMAGAGLDDANHPLLSLGEDGTLSLIFQARARGNGDTWNSLQPFVSRVEDDGKLSAAVPVPAGGETGTRPHAATGNGGRIFVAWASSGDKSVELARGRVLP